MTKAAKVKPMIEEAEWAWVEPHLKRDAVILVNVSLDLPMVAEKIAIDDKPQIQAWIEKGLISKPTIVQIENWAKAPQKKFLVSVVQPYVLAQEYLLH